MALVIMCLVYRKGPDGSCKKTKSKNICSLKKDVDINLDNALENSRSVKDYMKCRPWLFYVWYNRRKVFISSDPF